MRFPSCVVRAGVPLASSRSKRRRAPSHKLQQQKDLAALKEHEVLEKEAKKHQKSEKQAQKTAVKAQANKRKDRAEMAERHESRISKKRA